MEDDSSKRQPNDTKARSESFCTCSLLATHGCRTLENQGFSAIQTLISITQEISSACPCDCSKSRAMEYAPSYVAALQCVATNDANRLPTGKRELIRKSHSCGKPQANSNPWNRLGLFFYYAASPRESLSFQHEWYKI